MVECGPHKEVHLVSRKHELIVLRAADQLHDARGALTHPENLYLYPGPRGVGKVNFRVDRNDWERVENVFRVLVETGACERVVIAGFILDVANVVAVYLEVTVISGQVLLQTQDFCGQSAWFIQQVDIIRFVSIPHLCTARDKPRT